MPLTKERFGGLLFLLLSLAYGYHATQIPGYPGDEYEPFTASTLPYALAGAGVLLSLLLICSPGGEPLGKESGNWRLVFALLGLMLVYGLALGWLGFLVATILFLIGGILRNMDANLEEAATILKTPRWRIISRITMPIVKPAMLSTFLLVFASSMSAYAVPVFLGSKHEVEAAVAYHTD